MGFVSIILHWTVALGVIALTTVGLYMTLNEVWPLYIYHKSFAVLLFPIILLRVIWRLKHGWPAPVGHYSLIEQRLAKMTHWLLLILMLLMPISGMIYSGASGHGFGVFGFELFPHQLSEAGEAIAYSESWRNFGQTAHHYLGYLMIAIIFLHLLGALKHHLIDKDETLNRMLGRKKT